MNSSIEYYKHPALSRSKLLDLHKSPLFFWHKHVSGEYEQEETEAMVMGRLVHSLILEPDTVEAKYIIKPADINRKGKANQEKYDQWVEKHKDKTIITEKMLNHAKAMCKSVFSNEDLMSILDNSEKEKPILFKYKGHEFKTLIDAYSDNNIIIDLKTTCDFKPLSVQSCDAIKLGYDIQCYLYSQAVMYNNAKKSQFDRQLRPTFLFVNISKAQPFATFITDAGELYEYGKYRTNKLLVQYELLVNKFGLTKENPWPILGDCDNQIVELKLPSFAKYELETALSDAEQSFELVSNY